MEVRTKPYVMTAPEIANLVEQLRDERKWSKPTLYDRMKGKLNIKPARKEKIIRRVLENLRDGKLTKIDTLNDFASAFDRIIFVTFYDGMVLEGIGTRYCYNNSLRHCRLALGMAPKEVVGASSTSVNWYISVENASGCYAHDLRDHHPSVQTMVRLSSALQKDECGMGLEFLVPSTDPRLQNQIPMRLEVPLEVKRVA